MSCARFVTGDGWNVPLDTAILAIPWDDCSYCPKRETNAYDLGSTTRRWRTVYSINALNTSDRNEKKNISGSDLGLSFINSLNPVKYNWVWDNDDSPIHYGLIAQEVNEIASNENVAIVHKENDNWSMAYNELISPMIKAIQELSDEVNQLKLQLSQSQG